MYRSPEYKSLRYNASNFPERNWTHRSENRNRIDPPTTSPSFQDALNEISYIKRQLSRLPTVDTLNREQKNVNEELKKFVQTAMVSQQIVINDENKAKESLFEKGHSEMKTIKRKLESLETKLDTESKKVIKLMQENNICLTMYREKTDALQDLLSITQEKITCLSDTLDDVVKKQDQRLSTSSIDITNATTSKDSYMKCNDLIRSAYDLPKVVDIDMIRVSTKKGKKILLKSVLKRENYFLPNKCFKHSHKGKMVSLQFVEEFDDHIARFCPILHCGLVSYPHIVRSERR